MCCSAQSSPAYFLTNIAVITYSLTSALGMPCPIANIVKAFLNMSNSLLASKYVLQKHTKEGTEETETSFSKPFASTGNWASTLLFNIY